jgi:hypothetical protein
MAGAGASAAAAIAEAIKASGAIVRVEPLDFVRVLTRQDAPLVILAQGGMFGGRFQYLTSYKGFVFFVKTSEPLHLPDTTEVIHAKKIWVPG